MHIAFSPCPNDTFIFHAWVHQLLPCVPKLNVTYADIDLTNEWSTTNMGPDILKISCAALPFIHPEYTLLPCGGALGRGHGPLLLTRKDSRHLHNFSSLIGKKIAIPSNRSTAYLLFQLWAKQNLPGKVEICTLPFREILTATQNGTVDAGLVIHEARFTYPSYGLVSLIDLGAWWEEKTGLPIPLGAIIARRSLDLETIIHSIRTSLSHAWKYPNASKKYIAHLAQEMDPHVIQEHIQLYVNSFSYDLGEQGIRAISTLLSMPSHTLSAATRDDVKEGKLLFQQNL